MDAITIQIVSVVAILGFLWKLHHEVSNLHKDNANLRKEVSQDMADLRQEVGKDMAGLRDEVGKDMAGLREEFGMDIAGVRQDIGDLRERMARVEGLLEGFVGRPPEPQA